MAKQHLYDKLEGIFQTLTKQNEVLAVHTTTLLSVKDQTEKTNGRVGKLEVWRTLILGAYMFAGAITMLFGFKFWANALHDKDYDRQIAREMVIDVMQTMPCDEPIKKKHKQ